MWLPSFLVSLAVLSVAAIKIPIENTDNNPKSSESIREVPIIEEQLQAKPIYYASDEVNVDSYLIPPNPHQPEEVFHDVLVTPATFLLPPALNTQNEYYYKPTEPGEQSDWYPIAAAPQKQIEIIPIIQNEGQESQIVNGNFRTGKVLQSKEVPVPSRNLLPPREDAPNDFIILTPSVELELPSEEIDHTLNNYENTESPLHILRLKYEKQYPRKLRIKPDVPVPYITPPKDFIQTYKNPTLLYPKKFHSEFRPVPIPISQINEEGDDAKIVKGARPLKSISNDDNEYSIPEDEKKKYFFEKAERKRKLKAQHEAAQLAATVEPNKEKPLEQETSETHYREPGRDAYPSIKAPLAPLKQPVIKSNGDRTEFRMHGMKGPHSYQFGYDTGKGYGWIFNDGQYDFDWFHGEECPQKGSDITEPNEESGEEIDDVIENDREDNSDVDEDVDSDTE